jgi:hypothetical protein
MHFYGEPQKYARAKSIKQQSSEQKFRLEQLSPQYDAACHRENDMQDASQG